MREHFLFKWASCLWNPWDRNASYSELLLFGPSKIFLLARASCGEGVDTSQRGSLRAASVPLPHVRDVFEEGCHVGPGRAREMNLSLWPNECFRAVLIRDAALKQHPEGYWRRRNHHVDSGDVFGVGVNTVCGSSSAALLDTISAEPSLAPGAGLQHSSNPRFFSLTRR